MNRKLVGGVVAIVAVIALAALIVTAMKDDKTSTDTAHSSSENSGSNSHDDTSGASSDTGSSSESSNSTSSNVTEADEVEIEDFDFTPASIRIKKGTTVTWTNKDDVDHTVTADGGSGPDSEFFGKGESYSYTFNEVGTFEYFCKPHPSMTGEVTVIE